ncbi:cytochrome P450 [Allonocardiopsis opalescens]|uniref:Glycosyltransferase auxiliary protein/glycosyltransferase auxiliary protein DesVIII n=1 Tax=Allonocardiopsis opalescens TaxID=1144618 RepID=A0A2T0Q9H6_9ACTN|nr:cytochrome P450 [Allonocardiopsis opalescens]PRY00460.1 glycosyltransferase auxiliary protein/glycosyltransferase auxiliary protein DesVIII [Allonocardiopsis opalescens]
MRNERDLADHELGRRLQLAQALRWVHGAHGDHYARLLTGFDDDPYPLAAAVREADPLVRSAVGAWVTARYEVAAAVLADGRFGEHAPDGSDPGPVVQPLDLAPPGPAVRLDPGALAAVCADRAERLPPAFDLVADYARPCAAAMAAGLLDLPPAPLAALSAELAPALNVELAAQRLATAVSVPAALLRLKELGAAEDAVALVVALTEPVAAAVGNAVAALLPDRWPGGCAEPDAAAAVAAETLRFDPPVQIRARVAQQDVELAGRAVAAGEQVVVLVGGANRDPRAFTEPDLFRPDREPGPAEPIGPGAAGSTVHRLTALALAALAAHRPDLAPAGAPLRPRRSPVVRGWHSFPLAVAA